MGLLPLSYRRPTYVARPEVANCQAAAHIDSTPSQPPGPAESCSSNGVPPTLNFDRIVNGETCSPCTLRDFMNYLLHVERSAENLQFFLWHRDYERRFSAAKTADLSLAPEWTQAMEDDTIVRLKKDHAEKVSKSARGAAPSSEGIDFEESKDNINESAAVTEKYHILATRAFSLAGVEKPFRIQPFRMEVDRIIATYIMNGAPRQLNLSEQDRKAVLQALSYTTHPSAFRLLVHLTEATLREQCHPNFIRWSICNGNPARLTFALALGVGMILAGLVAALVLTLSSTGRGYRALAAIAWVVGFAAVFAARNGMCVILHCVHHRHIRPWEFFDLDHRVECGDGDPANAAACSWDRSGSTSSYEDEPWVVRYRKRHIFRKIFDQEESIQEPALRQVQNTIVVQSIVLAVVCTGVLTAVFVAVPSGGFF
ncbi:hypothetical protein VTI28DRAFT_937 [Corynascus sepedonium]